MEFTRTILDALKHWVNGRISNIEKALEGKQPSGDYALKSEIPSLEGIATEEYVDNALAEFVPGEGGGGSVQSDYNQNDSEAADYIKNRPFYMGDLVEIELVPEETFTIEEGYIQISDNVTFVDGKTYIVTFNGEQYECVAWTGEEAVCIGNGNIYGGEGMGDDVPFSCDSYNDGSCYLNAPSNGSYSIKITTIEQEIVKIDPKYLPEGGVGYVETGSTVEIFDIIQIANDFDAEWGIVQSEDSPTGKALIAGQFMLEGDEPPISFIPESKYQMTVNGISYTNKAVDLSSMAGIPYIAIGDVDVMMSEDWPSFRYLAAVIQPEVGLYLFQIMLDAEAFGLTETPAELTISSSTITEIVHKIDRKFLPNSGAKPDWNENNPKAEGYIANRPFYESLGIGDTIIEEQVVEINDDGYRQISDSLAFVEGEKYIVTFEGTEYECIAWAGEHESVCVGNGDIYGGEGKGNNEPFSCDSYPDGACYLNTWEPGEYVIQIATPGENIIKKIDKKFLPDDIGGSTLNAPVDKVLFIDAKTKWEYIGYIYDGNWITCRKPETIEITQMPDKLTYSLDEPFDPTGMIITATYSDGTTAEINNYTHPEIATDSLEIFCIDGAQTLSISLVILRQIERIEITAMPDKLDYYYGEMFDPTGMTVTGVFQNGGTIEITNYTYDTVTSNNFEIYCPEYETAVTISLNVRPELLKDFYCEDNGDNTYTLTGWRGTLNGQPSTEIIIPNDNSIIL